MKGKFFLTKKKKEKKEKKKLTGKKKVIIIAVSLVTVLVVVAGVAFFALRKNGNVENPFSQMMGNKGNAMNGMSAMTFGEGMVTVSGVINMGVTEESFEVENLTSRLEIEEVYVSSGQEIQAGDKVMKVSEESVATAREELEGNLAETELAYRAGVIEYRQSQITAKADYEATVLAGSQAEAIYQETIASLDSSVERAKEQLAEARAQIAEYETYVNSGSYKEYFKVDEYQAIYDENLKLLTDRMDEWGVTWSEVIGSSGGGANSGSGSMGGMQNSGDMTGNGGISVVDAGSDLHSQYVTVLSGLYSVLEDNLANLEQAQSDYEDAVENAALELQTLKIKLPSLEQAVEEAENSYELQVAQAKLTYESSLDAAARAMEDYETALSQAEDTYESLKEAYEDAVTDLEVFESSVGDGYYYAVEGGTLMRVGVRANQRLSAGSTILMYSDGSEMTITVSVDQSNIAALSVGDEAYIMATTGNGCSGTIITINPVTASDSRTNITYSVTIVVDGAESGFTANESVTVIFGVTAEEMESMMQGVNAGQTPSGDGTGMEGGQMPGGMGGQMPGGTDGQMPSGTDGQMPGGMDGQMPSGTDGQMPSGTDGQMPGSTDGQMPSGTDGQMPGGMSGNGGRGDRAGANNSDGRGNSTGEEVGN